jgi:hypothetical protein
MKPARAAWPRGRARRRSSTADVRVFVAAGAALGDAGTAPDAKRVARDVVRLPAAAGAQNRAGGSGRKLVDGRGAGRVAEAIRRLAVGAGRPEVCQHGEFHESSHLRSRRHALRA